MSTLCAHQLSKPLQSLACMCQLHALHRHLRCNAVIGVLLTYASALRPLPIARSIDALTGMPACRVVACVHEDITRADAPPALTLVV
jgi:hypothetical protein